MVVCLIKGDEAVGTVRETSLIDIRNCRFEIITKTTSEYHNIE